MVKYLTQTDMEITLKSTKSLVDVYKFSKFNNYSMSSNKKTNYRKRNTSCSTIGIIELVVMNVYKLLK
jgi:hypothetical protein